MKNPVPSGKRKAVLFGTLTVLAFSACIIFAPLGSFTIWITLGATVYFLFMAIYSLIPHGPEKQFVKKRYDPKAAEMKAYIERHTRILVGIFLGTLFFVLIFLWFVL
jgi:uncharacterized membrane protein YdfJ with MMPL/SSD domain